MKLTKALLAAIIIALGIGITACSTSDSSNPTATTSNGSTATVLSNSYFYSPTLAVSEDPINNPAPIVTPPGESDNTGLGKDGMRGHMGGGMMDNDAPKGDFYPLGRIFKALGLDSIQREQIKGFMIIKGDCVNGWMLKLRESELPILQDAKDKQAAIIADLKAGTITAAEARTKLKDLRTATKAALEANPVRAEVQAGLKDCEDVFLASIKSVLTADQLAKWEEFQANLDKWREKRRPGRK